MFVIYGADMELWLKHSKAFTYADDTSSSVHDSHIDVVKAKLEEDAHNVLKFMASNGLVANPSKTTLMVLNNSAKHYQFKSIFLIFFLIHKSVSLREINLIINYY